MSSIILRRQFLGGAMSAGLMAPFVRPLEAFAQTSVPPKRIVFWFQPNGVVEDNWFPSGGGRALASAADMGSSLAALAPWRSRINIIDDVEMYSSYHEPLRVAPHDAGCCELWTNRACQPPQDGVSFTHGGEYDSWSWPLGPSIDQFLADQAVVRGSTPIRSLELGVWVRGNRTNRRMSYSSNGVPVAPENDPRAAFQRVFTASGTATADQEEAARGRRQRQRILDRARTDLARLATRLGGKDRETLDRYASALESLERELLGGGASSGACDAPSDDEAITNPMSDAQIPAVGRMHMKTLAAALACDMTRVGSIMWMGSEPTNRMVWLTDEGKEQEYHLSSHGQLPGITSEMQRLWRQRTDEWFASQLAFFIGELERLDPSGALLDSTLIVCGNELRHGNAHSRDRIPFLTVGGDWYFETGYHRRGASRRRSGDLLAEVARAMGVNVAHFGDPMYCGGPALSLTHAP